VSRSHLLIVDDEPNVRSSLARSLGGHGYDVSAAVDGVAALDVLTREQFDAVLLDLMMPGMDGFEVLRRLQGVSTVPVIVLSARGDEDDKIRALDLGADDYVTKPFGIRELLARLRAVQRRVAEPSGPVVVVGDVTIDLERRVVIRGGDPVHLTPIEFAVLARLAEQPGLLVEYPQLVEAVWGSASVALDEQERLLQRLRVHVNALRDKLEPDLESYSLILTEPGRGYRLWPGS
jgi:two-component system KDP operon response regulator KdpE